MESACKQVGQRLKGSGMRRGECGARQVTGAEVAAVTRAYGAAVVDRPPEISGDSASSESALLHALDELERLEGRVPARLDCALARFHLVPGTSGPHPDWAGAGRRPRREAGLVAPGNAGISPRTYMNVCSRERGGEHSLGAVRRY